MKRVASILFFALIFNASVAQTAQEHLKQEADKYYAHDQYNLAVQYYRELADLSDQNAEIHYSLAESYRKTFNYTEAEVYYLKAYYQAPEKFPLALYYYALMLKLNGEFEESMRYFSEFIAAADTVRSVKDYVEQAVVDKAGSEMALGEISKPNLYPFRLENLNTVYNDYAPAVRDSTTLVITSGRVESNRDVIDERYGEGMTDNFYFRKNGQAWQDRTKQVFSITNSRNNDGSGCFNATGDKYYYTVCRERCQIYVSVFKDNKWAEPKILNDNVNAKSGESKHPAISHGGDTLLFASDRAGGFGNSDIWMSINSGNEDWGPAINMGNSINTRLNELSPAFTIFPHIFFIASEGHQNYGGLDLYMVKRFSNGTTALYNLDYPFNSNRDDCFISLDKKRIYFASNRQGGKGGFDIHSVTIPSIVSFTSRLSLKKKDARNDVKLNARTESVTNLNLLTARNEDRIEYENLNYEKRRIVDKMVSVLMNKGSNQAKDFKELSEADFNALRKIAETQYKIREIERQFTKTLLTRLKSRTSSGDVSVTGTLRDSVTGTVVLSRKILLMNGSGEVLKVTYTNDQGKFRFTNVSSSTDLYLRLETISTASVEKIGVENLTVTESNNVEDTFENIYFDFDHYTLRPEARQVLNDLAEFIKRNPTVQVEIFAYADDRGADDYNFTLTQKRGQAVLNYLTSKGIDETALAVIPKGKEKNITLQSEINRQLNRRVEFYLNGVRANSAQSVKTYILKEKSTWQLLSVSTGISTDQLKKLNGTTENALQMFQPVRLPVNAKIVTDLFFEIR